MNKKVIISILIVGIILAGFMLLQPILWKRHAPTISSKSFTVAKGWWPVWDTFQIGVQQREGANRSFRTTFLQREDYFSALNEFQQGNADAATLTIYEAILAASKGIPLKIVLMLDYTIGSDGVVAKKSISSLQELKDKRIGVEKGTIAHFTVLKMLEKAGFNQSEVKLINFNLDELQQAFLRDEIDAAAIYEPYMSEMARQGNGHIIFSSSEIPRAICDVLFVRDSIAREHPQVIEHWIEAWTGVLRFKHNQPEEYLHALNRLNGTPMPDLKSSLDGIFFTNMAENRIAFGVPERPGYLFDSLKQMEEFMLREGVIQESLPLQDLIESGSVRRFLKRQ